MKICNKAAFAFGVLCAGALTLFALGVIPADWWQWVITIAFAGKLLHVGLSETASQKEASIRQHYKQTAIKLYGKYALVKINLPLILLAVFFGAALFTRFVLTLVTPVSVGVAFCILLTLSVVYSISLDRTICSTIETEMGLSQ